MSKHKLLLLVALTIFLAISVSVSAFTTNPSSNVDGQPKIACNDTNCMLIWLRASSQQTSIDIYYQLLDHNGNSIGTETQLTRNAFVSGITSVVPGKNSFLIAWSDGNTQTITWRVVENGVLGILNPVNIKTQYGYLASAYDPTNNRYIIIYDDKDLFTTDSDLFSILLNSKGDVIGNDRLTGLSGNQFPTSLTFDEKRNYYMLAYSNYSSATQLRLTAVDAEGRLSLNQNNQPIDTLVTTITTVSGLPSGILSYDLSNSYIVVWEDKSVGQGDIFAQLIKSVILYPNNKINDITLSGSWIGVSTDPDAQVLYSAHFNRQENKHIIAWYANKLAVPGQGVYIQALDRDGNKLLPQDTKLNTVTGQNAETDLFFNSKVSKYLVPVRTAQNKITLSYFDTNTALSNPRSFLAPRAVATKKFVPTDLITNQSLADGVKRFNTIPIGFIDPTLGPKLIVDGLFQNGDVDVLDISIEATDNVTAVNLAASRNLGPKHTLVVPNNNAGKGVRACPQATKLVDVKDGCPGEIELSTVPSSSSGISLSYGTFTTQNDIYLIGGLNSSGAELLGTTSQPSQPQTQARVAVSHTQKNNSIEFLASYTYNNGTSIIQNPTCKIQFGDITGNPDMTYTPSLGGAINTYTRQFPSSVQSTYTVTCSHSNFTTETATESFSIQVAGVDNAPTDVSAESPIDGRVYSLTADVEFICGAKDDHNLNSLKLATNIPGNAEKTAQLSGKQNSTTWSIKNIPKGAYSWSCEAEDNSGKKTKSPQRSFTINFTSTTGTSPPISGCQENWNCVPADFNSIPCPSDGIKRRSCVDLSNCNNPTPAIAKPDTQACVPAGGAVCREDWSCTPVGSCVNNFQAVTCTDRNNCTNPTPLVEKPTKRACGATSGGGGENLFSNPLILGLIIGIVALVVVFFMIRKRKKRFEDEEKSYKEEKYGDDSELRAGGEEGEYQEGEGEYTEENKDDQEYDEENKGEGGDEEER